MDTPSILLHPEQFGGRLWRRDDPRRVRDAAGGSRRSEPWHPGGAVAALTPSKNGRSGLGKHGGAQAGGGERMGAAQDARGTTSGADLARLLLRGGPAGGDAGVDQHHQPGVLPAHRPPGVHDGGDR